MTPCELCRGACCETITLPIRVGHPDIQRWIELHGQPLPTGLLQLECACTMLKAGRCSIYDDRPHVCRDYPVGSVACRDAIKQRRTPEQAAEILALLS